MVLLEQFIKHLKDENKSHSTIIAYRKDIEQLLTYCNENIKNFSINKVTTKDINNFTNLLQEKYNLTLKTVSRKINSIRTFFKFLTNENIIKNNPAEKVNHPINISVPPRILSQMEYRALRDVARNNLRLFTMIELLLQTGIRIGELSRLQFKNVDINKTGKSYLHIEKFSTLPERKIELNQVAITALNTYINEYTGKTNTDGISYLFYSKSGKALLIRNIRTSISNMFKKAGIENATVNDIRNTFIVYQLKNGLNIEKLAEIVGHTKINTTSRYLAFIEEKPEKLHDRIIPL